MGNGEADAWIDELKFGGSIPLLEPENCPNGWANPPGDKFKVRGPDYLRDKVKIPGGEFLLKPLGFDWIKGPKKIGEVLNHSHHRVRKAIDKAIASGSNPFVWAFNLQLPNKDNYSAIAYFVATEPIQDGSLMDLFVKGDDTIRNSRLKLIANVVKGPWIVKTAVGDQAICILGRAVSCKYFVGPNFIEVDVDIGVSVVANAIVHLAFGYIRTLTVDLAFLIESQSELELPEKILGAVRFSELNPDSASFYEPPSEENPSNLQSSLPTRLWKSIGQGFSQLLHHGSQDLSVSTSENVNGSLHSTNGETNVDKWSHPPRAVENTRTMSDNADGGGGADHAQNPDHLLLLYEASRVSDVARELQDSASDLISRTWKEEQSLRQRALALDSDIRRLQSSLCSATKLPSFDNKLTEKIEEEIYRAKCLLSDGDVASLLPSKDHGRFLNMFLGPINVRATRKEVRLKVKEEYNSYRDRTAFLFLLFPSMLLFLRSWIWDGCFPALPVQLYQAWLLFLYTSLALRENILRVNGSDIRPWWVYHHYCAILMALVSLTWEIKGKPDCSNKQKGVQLFLVWAIMQGIAMLLQNRYQRQRLYTRIALGKAKRMDVVWGETAGVEGQLWLLYPILFILQGFEAYVGMLLLRTAFVGVISEWQVLVCGALLVLMAVGNFANTVQTLMAKSRFKAMKRSKSKNDFDQLPSPTYFR